jgi:hypothetical protein
MKYQLEQIFNEASVPTVTYVNPKEFPFIKSAIRAKGKHLTISGASGSGKTTVIIKALDECGIRKTDCLLVNAREFKEHANYFDMLARIVGEAPTFDALAPYLSAQSFVIIDDFHHLPQSARDSLSSDLKLWHEKNVRFIIIGIGSSARDLVSRDSELGIRNDPFDIGTQDSDFVKSLLSKGAKALGVEFSESFIEEICVGARGIPSVIHVIARTACIVSDVTETQSLVRTVSHKLADLKNEVLRVYHAKYFDKVVALAKGKQQARSVHNTYFDIVTAIAKDERTEIPVDYLYRTIVSPIFDSRRRNQKQTSYYNCLNYLGEVINESKLDDILYYRKTQSISIEDPSFRFYLNLLDLNEVKRKIHLRNDEYPWDVAVSFAGQDRDVVVEFVKKLEAKGVFPFYDFNYQANLWGVDLQDKLADIYANDALYMVLFISNHYPTKDWTKFEFEVGKRAAAKRPGSYLLPIHLDDVAIVGLSSTIGRVELGKTTLDYCVELLISKINSKDA